MTGLVALAFLGLYLLSRAISGARARFSPSCPPDHPGRMEYVLVVYIQNSGFRPVATIYTVPSLRADYVYIPEFPCPLTRYYFRVGPLIKH
jgi:hypothetical protein